TSEGDKLLEEVSESTKRGKVIAYGKDQLPATSGISEAAAIVLVEGRADVINLLRAGIQDVVALEGTKVPQTIIDLCGGKHVTAFLDGDHSGDLISKELSQVVKIDRMIRAPSGKEVEELTPVEIQDLIKGEKQGEKQGEKPQKKTAEPKPKQQEAKAKVNLSEDVLNKVKEVQPTIDGTLEAVVLDKGLDECCRLAVSELVQKLGTCKDPRTIVFDGIITQRLVETSSKCGVTTVVGHRMGEITKKPSEIALALFGDL
ncbi:MAG: toprim domain-containing protein, partial [Nitrososphaerales archaeon]